MYQFHQSSQTIHFPDSAISATVPFEAGTTLPIKGG
jgi:hypothetical protein